MGKNSTAIAQRTAGRPSLFDQSVVDQIIQRVSNGATLRESARDIGVPESTVREWINSSDEITARYARARQQQAAAWSDAIKHRACELAITGDPSIANVAKAKLEIDTMKWLMARTHPAVWGDKVTVENQAPKVVSAEPIEADAWEATYGAPMIEGETVK